MAPKNGNYAILEALRHEMLADPHVFMLYQSGKPTAVSATGQVIDLYREFGPVRIPDYNPIDEEWYVGCVIGAALTGNRAVAHVPSMCTLRTYELVYNQIGKLRHMTGGQANLPLVIWQDGAGRRAGSAGQHADAGAESQYMALPGLTVVVPSNPYMAKGLFHAAMESADPVIFYHFAGINNIEIDVPDEKYTIPIGRVDVRREGNDITIAGHGDAVNQILGAQEGLQSASIDAEIIDVYTLKPVPTEQIIASVRKTGKFLYVDHGHETAHAAAEFVARVAMAVPGARVQRITFPDAPPPGSREMITWMTPDSPKVVEAARRVVAA